MPYERESFNIFFLLIRNCLEEREEMIVLKREKRRQEMFRERKEMKRERRKGEENEAKEEEGEKEKGRRQK